MASSDHRVHEGGTKQLLCAVRVLCGEIWFRNAFSQLNRAHGMSDMAGNAARAAVERSGSCRDTMEPMGVQRQ
jgi:hypothetical protein